MDTFSYYEGAINNFEYSDKVVIYDYYDIEDENDEVLYLADEKYSIFKINGMIQYGDFHANLKEVIVTHEYIKSHFSNSNNFEDHIGTKIEFKNREYVISVILYPMSNENVVKGKNKSFLEYYDSDIYYRRKYGNIIFIPYAEISANYPKYEYDSYDCESVMYRAYIENLYSDIDIESSLRNRLYGSINIFDNEVTEAQKVVDRITLLMFVIFIVCFVIACIFISSQVQIELFYRRKELGFLQILGMKKKQIERIIMTLGYMLKMSVASIISVILYIAGVFAYKTFFGKIVLFNVLYVVAVIVAVMLYIMWWF